MSPAVRAERLRLALQRLAPASDPTATPTAAGRPAPGPTSPTDIADPAGKPRLGVAEFEEAETDVAVPLADCDSPAALAAAAQAFPPDLHQQAVGVQLVAGVGGDRQLGVRGSWMRFWWARLRDRW
jgi:hypothetical protein